ncbi:hypothetical protein BDF20DRAFT_814509 [Mycotypha africana]|uniref:uncharacterized protein n=1 Tax=Mycotypha africana TaxID=64632 RepID=UPI0022FFF3B0|nr:uncharacterized protein BDF20DRAFT_814509 [Mycotypha africana]KAI8988363.1 hypothetical protein BDF20DRAFT_814509 [Mycotypha africana]
MLNPAGNYVYQLADPDINFDWETIEQILISSAETQFCPICLSPPTAARVTKCGHIYCLPCILHYLELRENTKKLWRKCPICWESIYEADLKPKALACGVAEGDTVDMILIQRPAHSTLAFPLSDTWPLPQNVISNYVKPDTPLIPWHFTPAAMHFARFMLASPDYLDAEYHRDTMELKDALSDAQGWGGFDEIPYIEASLKKISETQKRLQTQKTKELALAMHTMDMMLEAVAKYAKKHPPCAPAGSSAREQPPKMMEEEKKRDVSKKEEKMKVEVPEAYLQYQLQQAGADFKPPPPQQQQQQQQQQKEKQAGPATDYFFYQAVDGQHVYLHPLDIRILKHEFGEYQDFPLRLQVQATAVQESTLTEELRKKCKYLGHLPLACDVTFLEINVKDIVSADTYQHFHQELNARVKKRKEKERREEQKKQQAESKHKLQQHVREHEMERQQLLENDPFFSMYRPPVSAEESEEHLSQALSESAASAELSAAPSPSAVHDGSRTVWGTRKVPSREEELMMRNHAHEWADHIILHKSHRKKRVNKNKK